jgi:hypothetical protein
MNSNFLWGENIRPLAVSFAPVKNDGTVYFVEMEFGDLSGLGIIVGGQFETIDLRTRHELFVFIRFLKEWLRMEDPSKVMQTIKKTVPGESDPDLVFEWISNGEIFRLGDLTFKQETLQAFIEAIEGIWHRWDELTDNLAAADADEDQGEVA